MAVSNRTQTHRTTGLWWSFRRRYREFALIARDPVLMISLLFCGLFLFIFVVYPLFEGTINGFVNAEATGPWYTRLSLDYFTRYFDSYYGPYNRQVFMDTLTMGVLTATGGTILGFVFAYTMVRCSLPFKRLIHLLALVPTVSPPFAIALSTILLFGRNGLISHKLLGIEFSAGVNDIYGMDGLVFVQVISFFSVAYLIVRAMLERLDPSMEEAAHSLGAGKFHIFRTVTLPLLIPGIAGSFLLLFVESLADLGNPLFIAGNTTVLSAQIFLAVAGEYNYQKASALAFVLIMPTLIVFLVQRYYVTRRSYVSVTGKPTGGHILVKEAWIRWPFIIVTYAVCLLIVVLYVAVFWGSFAATWGVDYTPTLQWWNLMFTRGVESILDTTFLSAFATPIAGLTGMVIAFLVVRKKFTGKDAVDFVSNLGGAVPGTILGIGFVLAFSTSPTVVVGILYGLLALFLTRTVCDRGRDQIIVLGIGTALGLGLALLYDLITQAGMMYMLGVLYVLLGLLVWLWRKNRRGGWLLMGLGLYLASAILVQYLALPIAELSRAVPKGFFSNAIYQFSEYIQVFFQMPTPLSAIFYTFATVLVVSPEKGALRLALTAVLLGLVGTMCFMGKPLALVGTPFIIVAAFAVRSLPASVRAGVAALQQIDPSIEEASNILGADAEYTFRKVTLPLILPALLAGLIFSFTRHMTSLSAIIFLVSPRWNIVTAKILSEWEQGGISIAAAYSTTIIVLVLIAIAVLYFVVNRMLGSRGDVDLSLGA
ncbi:MAG: iron ABC transporter permease [Chloroflexi bacterium]|nr:iron ABC transporter permease [Chloroflexota bacterium]MBU1750948.1 iron ABC transporter permease [Chloroflexota bacterium]